MDQLPGILEQSVNAALSERGVAVLTLPGDVGGLDLPKHTPVPRFVKAQPVLAPDPDALRAAADAINAADSVTHAPMTPEARTDGAPTERSMDPAWEVQERDPPLPVTDQELDLLRRSVTAEPASMGALVEGMSPVTAIPYVF